MKLLSIVIVRMAHHMDKVSIETDLPEPIYPFGGHLHLDFSVAKGKGEEYCRTNFPDVPVKAIV